jgi:hypothetical protein
MIVYLRRRNCPRTISAAWNRGPDLASMKDFLHFYIIISWSQLTERPTVDFINIVVEWFFAGFAQVISIETNTK